jgi:O-antigen ligase
MDALLKKQVFFFYALFAMGCWAALYFRQPVALVALVGLAAAFCLTKYPLVLFYTLVASIPWSIEYSVSPSLSTDLPDEPLMLLMAFVVVALLVQRRRQGEGRLLSSVLFVVLMLQFGWYAVSAVLSSHPLISFKFVLAKTWYLLAFVGAPLLLLKEPKHITRLTAVLLVSMLSFTLLVLVRHGGTGFTFESINDSLAPFFRNHVNYSALLVCVVPLLVAFLSHASSLKMKALLIVLLIVALAALYFSYARGAWLALVVGAAAYWLLKKRLLVWAYVTVLMLVVGSVFWLKADNRYLHYAHDYKTTIFHTDFREHLVATYQLKDVSTAERFYRWIAGVRMVKDGWQTGYGPNTFYYHYQRYAVTAFKTWVSKNEDRSTVHNYFLLTLIEQGVMGLLLLLFLLGYMFYVAQRIFHATTDRYWKTVMATVAVVLAMVCTVNFLSDLIETDKVGSIFYLCLALLIMGELRQRNPSELSAHV